MESKIRETINKLISIVIGSKKDLNTIRKYTLKEIYGKDFFEEKNSVIYPDGMALILPTTTYRSKHYPYLKIEPIDIAASIIGNISIDLWKNNDGTTSPMYWSQTLHKYVDPAKLFLGHDRDFENCDNHLCKYSRGGGCILGREPGECAMGEDYKITKMSEKQFKRLVQEKNEKIATKMTENGLMINGKQTCPRTYEDNLIKGVRERLYTP